MDYDTFKRAAIRDQDTIEQCPYNKSHQISKSKMQYHLVKCAKQHEKEAMETCPFNATHRIPKPEMSYHVAECPDRRIVDSEKYRIETEGPKREVNSQSYAPPPLPPSDENWDEEDLQSSYEPEKHVKNKLIFRNLQGATKSQRKQFCQEERRRFNQLTSEESVPEPVPVPVESDGPLRPPKTLPKELMFLESNSRLGMGRGSSSSSSVGVETANVVGKARGRGIIHP